MMFVPSGVDQCDEMNGKSQKCNQSGCCSQIGRGDCADTKAEKADAKGGQDAGCAAEAAKLSGTGGLGGLSSVARSVSHLGPSCGSRLHALFHLALIDVLDE